MTNPVPFGLPGTNGLEPAILLGTARITIDSASIWQQLPLSLKTKLQGLYNGILDDNLLTDCIRAVDQHDIPVFWRPSPETFTQHRLHSDFLVYIQSQPVLGETKNY